MPENRSVCPLALPLQLHRELVRITGKLYSNSVRTFGAVGLKRISAQQPVIEGSFELSSGWHGRMFNTMRDVPVHDWDALVAPQQLFLRSAYLQTFEATAGADLSFQYVLLYAGEVAVAAYYFQVIHLSAELMAAILEPMAKARPILGLGSNWNEWLRRCREECGMRLLISGNNFVSGEYGVAIKHGVPADQAFAALAEVVRHITDTQVEPVKISAILVKDYYKKLQTDGITKLKKYRYHTFQVEPEMIVPLRPEWNNFDAYVAAMVKKYRTRTRSVFNKTAELRTEEWDAATVARQSAALYALYQQVHQRARFRITQLEPDYFVQLKAAFPESFRITAYFLHDQLVGFRSSFLIPAGESGRPSTEGHFIGVDYTINARLPLYQRMLYDFVAEGIAAGSDRVFLGRTAPEIKSTVGAVAHELVCCIRHRNGISNQIIRPFIDYLQPSPWVPRNPFARQEED